MIFRKIAKVVLVSVLLFSCSQIAIKIIDYKKSEKLYSDIQNVVETTENKKIMNTEEDKKENKEKENEAYEDETYKKLVGINTDYQFWVEVENTNINYPVVQTTDNSFYLKKDFNKNYSSSGTIFMDKSNNFKKDNHIVLYGHNMNNKTMFNNVTLFKREDFFNQNNKIKIKHANDGKEYVYEVFSVYYTDNSFDYNTVMFTKNYSFMDFMEDIKEKSMYYKPLDINENDKILTLSTCSYEFKGAKTIIHAKLVETKF